jgi:hypothetical protein
MPSGLNGPVKIYCVNFRWFNFRKFRIAWKAILWVTEVHTRRRRGCPRIESYNNPNQAWKAVHDWLSRMTFRDVLPSRQ